MATKKPAEPQEGTKSSTSRTTRKDASSVVVNIVEKRTTVTKHG